MCWCWSDKPQHRPTFNEVLKVIKTDSFTHLLEATPVSRDHGEITAACTSYSALQNSLSVVQSTSFSGHGKGSRLDKIISHSSVVTMLSSSSSSSLSNMTIQVWYGTKQGKCGVVNLHNSVVNYVSELLTIECVG